MSIQTKRLLVIIVALAAFGNAHTARTQTSTPKDQIDLRSQHRPADLGIDVGSVAQLPGTSCSQARPEPPIKCDCTDSQGKVSPRQAACYSCWNPSDGQKCGGPYCQSCVEVCNAGGAVPYSSPTACAQSPHGSR